MSDFIAQKKRYTFGNDEFSLGAAYHDCKLVFDGITDDDSFQEADTGLILYYANEIIYALQETLQPEQKTGRWYIDAEGNVRCAACKTKCLRDDIGINILSSYCPHCGTKMGGEKCMTKI